MTLSERLRESTRDVVTGEKLFAGAFGHAPIEYLDEAADELDRLTARVAELEKDAERYRWLRKQGLGDNLAAVICTMQVSPEQMDAAIDAAGRRPMTERNNPHAPRRP